jgi:hypothetical protein
MEAWLLGVPTSTKPDGIPAPSGGIAHHADSVKVLHTSPPFAVVLAGEGEFDPFKD